MMYEQLMAMDVDKVERVCVDGVYFEEHEFEMKNVFRRKEVVAKAVLTHVTNSDCYTWSKDCKVNEMEFAPARESHRVELHKGPGGSGKTHLNLHDTGLVRLCYMAPSHKLCARKRQETGQPARVHAVALSADTTKHEEINRYNTLVIDEVSMMSDECKNIFISRFPHHKLLFVGDIGYQLPPVAIGDTACTPFNEFGVDFVRAYTTSYRCKCERLAHLQAELRRAIDLDEQVTSKSFLSAFVACGGSTVSHDRLRAMYQIEDMIITYTHRRTEADDSVSQEAFYAVTEKHCPRQKYQMTHNNQAHTKGEIVIDTVQPPFSKIRHTYTVHCLQGETLHRPHRVFIDLYKFDRSPEIRQLLYTAISRAETLDQIFCLKGSAALCLHSEQANPMPTHEAKYAGRTGRIYKLYSPAEPNFVYIGHTIQSSVKERFKRHVMDFMTPQCKKCSSFAIWEKHDGNVTCEQVQEVGPLESRTQLLELEQAAIEAHRANGFVLANTANAIRQDEQRHTCECGTKYLTRNKGRHFKSQAHTKWAQTEV
jgi:hypothetical protein